MVRRGHLHVRRDRLLEPLRARRALAHDVHRLLQLHVVRAELTQRAAGEKVEALLQGGHRRRRVVRERIFHREHRPSPRRWQLSCT